MNWRFQILFPISFVVISLLSTKASSDDTSSYEWVNSSKLLGEWRLEYILGLDADFQEMEKEFLDQGKELLWDTTLPATPLLSYKYIPQENLTIETVYGCNQYEVYFIGNLQLGIDNVEFNGSLPSTDNSCTALVRNSTGETVPIGTDPIHLITDKYFVHRINANSTIVSDDGKWLTYKDVNGVVLMKFVRMEEIAE